MEVEYKWGLFSKSRLARWMLRREREIYRRLEGFTGSPRCHGLLADRYLVLDYIDGDSMPFESEPLSNLATDSQLAVYRHTGFWHAMDTHVASSRTDERVRLWNMASIDPVRHTSHRIVITNFRSQASRQKT